MSDNKHIIYVVSYEIPEDHGSHAVAFSVAEAKEIFDAWVMDPEAGQITRMYKMDVRQMLNDALDEILWMQTVSMEDAGLVEIASHNENAEPLAPEQVEKLAEEWALSHGLHSYDDINIDIMEQFEISFAEANQITEFLDAHAATATLTFESVA